jgi:hypothetical protein
VKQCSGCYEKLLPTGTVPARHRAIQQKVYYLFVEVKFLTFKTNCIYYFSAPGRKKKVVEEIKLSPELPHPAEVFVLSTEHFSTTAKPTSAATIGISSSLIQQSSSAVTTKQPLTPLTAADQHSSSAPNELHASSTPDEQPVKLVYAPEQPSSTTLAKISPASISAETSAEVSSLAAPTDVLSTPEITAGSPSPCPTSSVSTVQVFEEETRMSAESGSRSQTPARTLPPPGMGTLSLVVSRTK